MSILRYFTFNGKESPTRSPVDTPEATLRVTKPRRDYHIIIIYSQYRHEKKYVLHSLFYSMHQEKTPLILLMHIHNMDVELIR